MESALHRIRRLGGKDLLLPQDITTLNAGVAKALALISDGQPHTGPEITRYTGMDSGRRRMREVRQAVEPYGFRLPCWRASKDSMIFYYQLMPALTGEEIGMKLKELANAVLELTNAAEKLHQSLVTFENAVSKASDVATELKQKAGDVEIPVPPPAPAPAQASADPAQPQVTPGPAAAAPAISDEERFVGFSDTLRELIRQLPPGSLNQKLAEMINRYAPGAAAPGQGGIRKIPVEQYDRFLAEIRAAVAGMTGTNP